MKHYNVKYWETFEDYWVDHKRGKPTSGRYYDTHLKAASRAAKSAVDNGSAAVSKVVTTSGEVVCMYADCGPLGTGWID